MCRHPMNQHIRQSIITNTVCVFVCFFFLGFQLRMLKVYMWHVINTLTWILQEEWNVVAWCSPIWAVVEAIAEVSLWPNCGSYAISRKLHTIFCEYNLQISSIHSTAPSRAVDPLLSVTPCYLLYISDEGVFEEEGCWGEKEGSSAICRTGK